MQTGYEYTYEYMGMQYGDYIFKRYYLKNFDGFNSFNLKRTLNLLKLPYLIYNEETKTFLEYLKLQTL